MTTSDFTEAARAEGQARIAAMLEVAGASGDIRAWFPAGFEKGAEWARTHLAAQEPSEEAVERASEVWQAHSRLHHPIEDLEPSCEECGYAFGWPGISEAEEGKRYREHVAREVLRAAREEER